MFVPYFVITGGSHAIGVRAVLCRFCTYRMTMISSNGKPAAVCFMLLGCIGSYEEGILYVLMTYAIY